MLYGEYRLEDEIAIIRREVREDTLNEVWSEALEKIKQEKLKIARNSLTEGATVEFVQKITGLDLEIIQGLKI